MHSGRSTGHIEEKCIFLQERAISMVGAGEGHRRRETQSSCSGWTQGAHQPGGPQASSLRLFCSLPMLPKPEQGFPLSKLEPWAQMREIQKVGEGEGEIGPGLVG